MDFFAKSNRRFDFCALKFNHYPPCDFTRGASDGASGDAAIRLGEHTDFGSFTFLFLDGAAPGLQVRKASEGDALSVLNCGSGGAGAGACAEWLDAPGRGGASVVVNSGALLAQWTNDQWRATAHRVIVPNEVEASRHRYSLPFFVLPDAGTVIKAHASLVPEGETPR